jgi:hypothetical protein
MKTKTQEFKETYGMFQQTLVAETKINEVTIDTSINLEHKKTIKGVLISRNRCVKPRFEISIVCGKTPPTYYSGNRMYGKYIFVIPENVVVVRTIYQGKSNLNAWSQNKSSLKLAFCHNAQSVGFDFFLTQDVVNGEAKYQKTEKLSVSNFEGFGELEDHTFIKHAMSVNLPELIPNFPYQTQGWNRNGDDVTTHLYKINRIKGTYCEIFFAADKDYIEQMEEVSTVWVKCLHDADNILEEEILEEAEENVL